MLDQIMHSFNLTADYDLNVMTQAQSPAEVAARVLELLPPVLREVKPDMVLVQGDTTTTCAAAMAAFLERIPVGHVEAGLRTGDLQQPFPEEMNRRVTTIVSALHFAPTQDATKALLAERVPAERIIFAGNTVIDALLRSLRKDYQFADPEPCGAAAGQEGSVGHDAPAREHRGADAARNRSHTANPQNTSRT